MNPKSFPSPRRAGIGAVTSLTPALLMLALCCGRVHSAKPGSGGGGGTVTELPVPPVVAAPVSYQITQLLWENAVEAADPEFQGIYINGVNSRGLVTGHVKRAPAVPDTPGERRGTLNIGSAGEATDTMVDLNALFADALAQLNARRVLQNPAEEPWRIAYGRRINEAGQIACQLLPQSAARSYGTGEGGTPVPSLNVVAHLATGTLIEVDPNNTSPDQEIMEMNENGDLLVMDYNGTAWGMKLFVFHAASGTYVNQTAALPASVNQQSFNTSLQVSYATEVFGRSRSVTDRLFRRTPGVSPDVLLWENAGKDYDYFYWEPLGVAESGSVYAAKSYRPSTGVRITTPYHVISPTQRRPLTTGTANGLHAGDQPKPELSRAALAGEEEIAFSDEGASGPELQMYKPKFGARFKLPAMPPLPGGGTRILSNLSISPPHNRTGSTAVYTSGTYTGPYFGGYIAITERPADSAPGPDCVSYLLTPAGATPPGIP